MRKKYSIGIDFGTLSGRAVLVDIKNGEEIGIHITPYSQGVIDDKLPASGKKLGHDWALQDPEDYLKVLYEAVPAVIEQAGIKAEAVIGLGVDFTSCTMLPVDSQYTPLCMLEEYRSEPNSWVKLWKHHAAQVYADRINRIAADRGESFIRRYGGKVSSEWMFPKILQILEEAPEIYSSTYRFMEAGDWIVYKLTGNERRNSCSAGCKALWSGQEGYPGKEFFKAVDPRLENVVEEKMGTEVYAIGGTAGGLVELVAERMGLMAGTPVALANTDAHIAVPALGVTEPGKLVMIIGTSTCHFVLGEKEIELDGICQVAKGGIIQGLYDYEAGQSCVGDHFGWFVKNCVPESYNREAAQKGISIFRLLDEKASKLKPGESGLLALDWWNGNRSILVDADLSGMLLGATLSTKPEEIFRALVEATAFGTRMIIENFIDNVVPVKELYACGGLSHKSPFMMQLYADIVNMEIRISASKQTPAFGAAMYGAVAAGREKGGYDDIREAAKRMARLMDYSYKPIKQNTDIYDLLYEEYKKLYYYFGRGENTVMKTLKRLKKNAE